MPEVKISCAERSTNITIPVGATLLEAMQRANVEIASPCGGAHRCGKCEVAAGGALSGVTEREASFFEQMGDQRLACFARVMGDCYVTLSSGQPHQIAADHIASSLPPEPIYASGYGAAVDVGTTTVVGYLFSHGGNTPLATRGELNRQQTYGADVLSRIAYCNENTVAPLRDLIREQLADLLDALCQEAGAAAGALAGLCVTGNTTMLHILAGLPPGSLALAPFTPQSLFGGERDLTLPGFAGVSAYLPPCISSYVGADTTCAILAAGVLEREDTVLLVDVGTNGEVALWSDGKLLCCSTAAGPAFEGAGISAGTGARAGAINTVSAAGGSVTFTTLRDAPPAGICGSGLIDAVAAMLELGVLDKTGRMDAACEKKFLIGDSGIALTQGDVRQFQLAKGAIRAGIDTLLSRCGLGVDDIGQIILCGGFGSYLNPVSAERTGLLPRGAARRTISIGNAAGAGAGQILQYRAKQSEALRIAERADAIDLGSDPYFKKRYMEVMRLEVDS